MRVLQVINSLKLRGAEVVATQLSLGLQAAGCDVTVLVLNEQPSAHAGKLAAAKIPVRTTGPWNRYSPRHAARIAEEIDRRVYDVVHAHLYPAQLWIALAAVRTGRRTPLITTEHGVWNWRRRFHPLVWLDRWTYARFDAVACISTAVEASLQNWLGASDLLTRVIPNGASIALSTQPLDKTALFQTERGVILCVGGLVDCKNQAVLIDALALCPGVELFLAGDGPLRDSLHHQAARLKIADRVHFLGERNDVPELMAAADVYVQPSRREGFGLAALEAMAAGKPLVVSDVPGLRDLVGGCALKVAPESAEGFAQAITRLLTDAEFAKALSHKAVLRAKEFSTSKMVGSYMNLYRDVLAQRRPAGAIA